MKQTFTYWIYAKPRGSQLVYELSDLEWTESGLNGRVLIEERTLTLDLPDLNEALPKVVAALEVKKKEMLAVSKAAIAEVDNQIQSLLAIGHEVSA